MLALQTPRVSEDKAFYTHYSLEEFVFSKIYYSY